MSPGRHIQPHSKLGVRQSENWYLWKMKNVSTGRFFGRELAETRGVLGRSKVSGTSNKKGRPVLLSPPTVEKSLDKRRGHGPLPRPLREPGPKTVYRSVYNLFSLLYHVGTAPGFTLPTFCPD